MNKRGLAIRDVLQNAPDWKPLKSKKISLKKNVFRRTAEIRLGRHHAAHTCQDRRRCAPRLGQTTLRRGRLHGAGIARRRAFSRTDGATLAPLHRGTLRAHRLDVHPPLPHQLLHKFLRVLQFPRGQQDAAHNPHARRNGARVRGHQAPRPLREPAARDGREPRQSRHRLSRQGARPRQALFLKPQNRGDAPARGGLPHAYAPRHERRDLLSGNLSPRELQTLSPARHEVELRVARERLRPHGRGGRALHRHGRAHRP